MFLDTYRKLKVVLQTETTKLQELTVSYDTLLKHDCMTEDVMTALKEAVEQQKNKVDSMYDAYLREKVQLDSLKNNYKSKIISLYNSYCELDKESHEYDKPIEPDDFMVSMNKFLYPNNCDNLQLRSDPKIAGITKADPCGLLPGYSNSTKDMTFSPFTTGEKLT